MRPALSGLLASFMATPVAAEGADYVLRADASASSKLIDRGEQIAGPALEAALTVERIQGTHVLYASVYRITPVGSDQGAYADEVDYTLGIAGSIGRVGWGASASWLTYPGLGTDDESLELAGEMVVEGGLSPTLAGFYDAEFADYGLELTAGPEWTHGDWTVYALGRGGFVTPGDGSPTRSYWGAEAGAVYPVSDRIEIGGYVRAEAADEDSFVREVAGRNVVSTGSDGLSAGIALSLAH